ncbi:23781_t:CDS:2, partial [Racocetra persica]
MSNHSMIEKSKSEIKTFELGDYPQVPTITYQETKNNYIQRSFNYFIEAEGFYPNALELRYTLPPKKYPIPDDYSIKTTWELYGTSFEYEIESNISATNAATNYEKAINMNTNKKSLLSGPLLFGLQLQKLRTIREFHVRQHITKPMEQYSETTLRKRAKEIATIQKEFIQNVEFKYNAQDSISLKSFEYTVNNQNYYFDFGNENLIQKKIE